MVEVLRLNKKMNMYDEKKEEKEKNDKTSITRSIFKLISLRVNPS